MITSRASSPSGDMPPRYNIEHVPYFLDSRREADGALVRTEDLGVYSLVAPYHRTLQGLLSVQRVCNG